MDNHVILLRVNQYWESIIHIPGAQLTREQMYEGSPNWLDIRLEWFEKYLLENLMFQSDMNFWCFMMIDPQTPTKYKEKLYAYEKLGFIKIVENNGDNGEDQNTDILKAYKSVRKNNSNEILCSRLDTDDMVGPMWNQIVKQSLSSIEDNIISLENVLVYNFLTEETKILNWKKGSFLTTKSTLDDFYNPRMLSHNEVDATVINTSYPVTCMGVHDNNVTNHNWWPACTPYPLEPEVFDQMFKIKR